MSVCLSEKLRSAYKANAVTPPVDPGQSSDGSPGSKPTRKIRAFSPEDTLDWLILGPFQMQSIMKGNIYPSVLQNFKYLVLKIPLTG